MDWKPTQERHIEPFPKRKNDWEDICCQQQSKHAPCHRMEFLSTIPSELETWESEYDIVTPHEIFSGPTKRGNFSVMCEQQCPKFQIKQWVGYVFCFPSKHQVNSKHGSQNTPLSLLMKIPLDQQSAETSPSCASSSAVNFKSNDGQWIGYDFFLENCGSTSHMERKHQENFPNYEIISGFQQQILQQISRHQIHGRLRKYFFQKKSHHRKLMNFPFPKLNRSLIRTSRSRCRKHVPWIPPLQTKDRNPLAVTR